MSDPGDEDCRIAATGASCEHGYFVEPYIARRLRARARTHFELHLFACEHCLRAVELEHLIKRVVSDFANVAQISRSWH
jgi:hypothetical protein